MNTQYASVIKLSDSGKNKFRIDVFDSKEEALENGKLWVEMGFEFLGITTNIHKKKYEGVK